MTELHEELLEIADRLGDVIKRADAPEIAEPLRRLEESATRVGKAWSGSALGYHARIYYRGLKPPPPGHHFSQEWGMQDSWPISATTGDWVEHDPDDIERTIRELAEEPDLGPARELAVRAEGLFGRTKSEVLSILSTAEADRADSFISSLREQVERTAIRSKGQVLRGWLPSGQLMSRDSLAVTQGLQPPPHLTVLAEVASLRQAPTVCGNLAELARKGGLHLARQSTADRSPRQAPGSTQAELSLPEKVTIAWAVRHVPLSAWLYLADIIGSAFIAGATVTQLPAVRSLLPALREDRPPQSAVTPSYLDERIRVLTEAHTLRVAKITEGIVAEERAAGLATIPYSHIEAAKRLRDMLREENESYQKALAQLKALGAGEK